MGFENLGKKIREAFTDPRPQSEIDFEEARARFKEKYDADIIKQKSFEESRPNPPEDLDVVNN